MNNKYIKSLGGEEHIEMLGTEGRITAGEESRRDECSRLFVRSG